MRGRRKQPWMPRPECLQVSTMLPLTLSLLPVALVWVIEDFGLSVATAHDDLIQLGMPEAPGHALQTNQEVTMRSNLHIGILWMDCEKNPKKKTRMIIETPIFFDCFNFFF